MKFAFSTVACPQQDFHTIAARAGEYGYDGVTVALQQLLAAEVLVRRRMSVDRIDCTL